MVVGKPKAARKAPGAAPEPPLPLRKENVDFVDRVWRNWDLNRSQAQRELVGLITKVAGQLPPAMPAASSQHSRVPAIGR
jgi:hypothetical protein